jgi:receptor protein-tyrosine kinase
MALTSVDPGDGKSFVCANLAVAFSQLGERTLLIDANLRDPRQHHFFRLRERMGLSGLLAGRAGLSQVRRIQDLPGLSVLPAGASPPNPQELLAGNPFRRLLTELSQHFGVILIDTPAAQTASDVHGVAVRAGAALPWVRLPSTKIAAAAGGIRNHLGNGFMASGRLMHAPCQARNHNI